MRPPPEVGVDAAGVAAMLHTSLQRVCASLERGDPRDLDAAVRTATTELHLTNLAAQIEESRAIRVDSALEQLRDAAPMDLQSLTCEPVLTAHPTEARRLAVMRRLADVRTAAETALGVRPSAGRTAALEDLDRTVELLWRTDSVRHVTLTVDDEIAFVETFLSGPLGVALVAVEMAAQAEAPATARSPMRIGSWVGGDQDGNPFATASHLRRSLVGSERIARARHREYAEAAAATLTVPRGAAELDRRTRRWLRLHAGARLHARHPGETLRLVAEVIAERVDTPGETMYRNRSEIGSDIDMLAEELVWAGVAHLVIPLLGPWRAWCRVAGLHLIDVDVRTTATALFEIANMAAPAAGSLWERPRDLYEMLAGSAAGVGGGTSEQQEQLLDTLAAWAEAMAHSPDRSGCLVISGCRSAGDIVAALWLVNAFPPLGERIRIAPLFEDEAALAKAGAIVASALDLPAYASQLERTGGLQVITLGYSDTTKEVGYLAGALSLRDAHASLSGACTAGGARPLFFHGRGGTIARGGGRTEEAVRAQPPGTLNGRLRWTEQGESIGMRFDDPAIGAAHLAEVVLALSARTTVSAESEQPLPEWIRDPARVGREVYIAWYRDPSLAAFHREFTPIDAIERLALGSRPARRGADRTPQTLRAIPWHFSWAQTRAVASVWVGAGTALRQACATDMAAARSLYATSTWFRSMIDNLEMVLFKTDWEVAELYRRLTADHLADRWMPFLLEENQRCTEAVLSIRGGSHLLDHEPQLRARILARSEAIRPLHALQVELLGAWRQQPGDDHLLRLVHGTVNGIAAGVQNTG